MEVLYASGLRVSELVALPVSARRAQRAHAQRTRQGGKERLVPLNEAAKTAMHDYSALLAGGRSAQKTKGCSPRSARPAHLTRQPFCPAS